MKINYLPLQKLEIEGVLSIVTDYPTSLLSHYFK